MHFIEHRDYPLPLPRQECVLSAAVQEATLDITMEPVEKRSERKLDVALEARLEASHAELQSVKDELKRTQEDQLGAALRARRKEKERQALRKQGV